MKFSDIPKFTRRPSYHVNEDLSHIEDWLNYHKEIGLELNPDFQRGHVWTETQQIAYIEYLLRGGSSGKEFYFNRVGGMHSFKNTKAAFVCVDGLQRLTTILRFLHSEIKAFGYYRNEYEDDVRMADVMFSMNINNLSNPLDVLTWYIEMNSGGTPHTEEELNRVREMLKN